MSRLMTGAMIILFLLVVTLTTAFIQTGASNAANVPGCKESNDATECNNVGATSFLRAVRDVSVGGVKGAPAFFNALWLLVGGFLLTVGILLIALSFIPATSA